MLKTWRFLLAFAAIGLAACGGSTITSPDEPSGSSDGTVTASTNLAPTPSPSATPTADAAQPYVEFANDGSGRFCNPMAHRGSVTITYTKELDLSVIFGTPVTYYAEPGKCVQIPPAVSLLAPEMVK